MSEVEEPEESVTSVLAAMGVPLDGPMYEDVHAHVTLEVRDFSRQTRTLVLRLWFEGHPYTAMVDWEQFVTAFDEMRAELMPADWDDALQALRRHEDPPGSSANSD